MVNLNSYRTVMQCLDNICWSTAYWKCIISDNGKHLFIVIKDVCILWVFLIVNVSKTRHLLMMFWRLLDSIFVIAHVRF